MSSVNNSVYNSVINSVYGSLAFKGGGAIPAFRFEVKTTGADTFQLPLEAGGTYDFNVDWGDGSSSDITVYNHADTNHSYSGAGTYNVVITGTITGWRFANSGDKLLIYDISEWGPLKFIGTAQYFYGCANLTVSATDALDITGVANMGNTFRDCTSITTIPSINNWDWSDATSIYSLFSGATSFNQKLTINTSSVTTASLVFSGAVSYDQDLGGMSIASITGMVSFLSGVTMSTENYSNTLIGFESQPHQDNVVFHGGNSTYNAAGATARAALIADGWTITDGGPA